MRRYRVLGLVGFVFVLSMSVLLLPGSRGAGQSVGKSGATGDNGRTIAMSVDLVGLEIRLGIKDTEQTAWDGSVRVSEGKVTELEIVRAARSSSAEGQSFSVKALRDTTKAAKKAQKKSQATAAPKSTDQKSTDQKSTGKARKKQQKKAQAAAPATGLSPAVIRASLEAPASATVTVATNKGDISFKLSELPVGTTKTFLDGQVSVGRHEPAVRLTGRSTEDDYPAAAKAADGTVWLAYVQYTPGRPILNDQVQARNFDSLMPVGNGDQIFVRQLDGKAWQKASAVTDNGLDVWRPAVTVAGDGSLVVAWAQKIDDDWEIFYRRGRPGPNGSVAFAEPPQRLTDVRGSDFHVVATTDAKGIVWLAWQAWRGDNFDIYATALADGHPYSQPKLVSNSDANDWTPAIAADSKGNVYIAWDTYAAGNYDVRLRVIGSNPRAIPLADTPRFEGRVHLACDPKDRLWIAYELGDEQWGKDYSTEQFDRIGLKGNPGAALYLRRTIGIKCLIGGELYVPSGSLDAACASSLPRNKSLPRIGFDAAGALWVVLRHHPLAGGGGEVWHAYALHYSGDQWSKPRELARSSNLLDHRPPIVPHRDGVLVVYSGDNRTRTQDRDQMDLFAAFLASTGSSTPPQLMGDQPDRQAKVAAVHEGEVEQVRKMRDFRLNASGKELRLVRGEFHRHTEYSAHRDQDGSLEDSLRYALDAGRLDWMGNGDHDNGSGHEFMWWQIQKTFDLMHNPPYFVAAMTYERSVVYPSGHRNVMFPRRGIRPLPRLVGNDQLFGSAEQGAPDIKLLYAYLKRFGGICAEHTSATNMGTDWRDNDPEVEPIVEIYQGHRHNYEHIGAPRSPTAESQIGGYQPAGFVWNALAKGYRLGFQASSDHMSTHMSYACVLVDDVSRAGIIDGFKKRHCYAATDNILLIVRSGEHLMGDAFTTKERPTLSIEVSAARRVAKVHVIRDNRYVFTAEPDKRAATLRYTDADARPGQTSYYYVRAELDDGNLAWASPMWITYQ